MTNEKNLIHQVDSTDVYAIPPDILCLRVNENSTLTVEESKTISDVAFAWFKGKYKVLTLPEEHAQIDADVRNFLVTPDRSSRVIADAIIITNLPHRLLADFYMRFQRPDIPTRFFKTVDEAIAWLRSC